MTAPTGPIARGRSGRVRWLRRRHRNSWWSRHRCRG